MQTDFIITKDNRAIVIANESGRFRARLYVNARDGIRSATATMVCKTFKSLTGATRWANAQVSA